MSRQTIRQQAAAWSVWLVGGLVLLGSIWQGAGHHFFEAAVGVAGLLIFSAVQFGSQRLLGLSSPPGMRLAVSLLTFVSLFLGRNLSLYRHLTGFDKAIHFLYGLAFAVIGLIIFYRVNPDQRTSPSVRSGFITLYLISFVMLCSLTWELFEFFSDRLFLSDMQAWKAGGIHGLVDTMLDLAADLLGGLAVSLAVNRQLRHGFPWFFQHYMSGLFSRTNPS